MHWGAAGPRPAARAHVRGAGARGMWVAAASSTRLHAPCSSRAADRQPSPLPCLARRPASPSLCSVPDECPEEMLDILRRCLHPDPGLRPTAAELVQLLTLVPAPPAQGAATPVRRRSGETRTPTEPLPSAPASGAGQRMGSVGTVAELSPAGSVLSPLPGAVLPPVRSRSMALPHPSGLPAGAGSPPRAAPVRHSGDWGAGVQGVETPNTAGTAVGGMARPSFDAVAPVSGPSTPGSPFTRAAAAAAAAAAHGTPEVERAASADGPASA